MPSEVTPHVGWFDRFATAAATFVAKPYFFAGCVLLILVWAPSVLLLRDVDTWQLIINTATTIVTFLLVGLSQNTTGRADAAQQRKLNAIADALADWMTERGGDSPQIRRHVAELRAAVGLEDRESA